MNYAPLVNRIMPKVLAIVALLNNPEIEPEIRQRNQEILFATVGAAVYNKVYDMSAFDFDIEHTRGVGIGTQHFGLAKLASGSLSTGRGVMDEIVAEYFQVMASKAQYDAFRTAVESGKHPTLTRRVVSETCDWCRSLEGVHVNPDPELFRRHRKCDCELITSGYKTRNGLLQNYVKSDN